MKAISLHRPWASMIVLGPKDVENRTWKWTYNGPVVIHAAEEFDQEAYEWLVEWGHIDPSWKPDDFEPGLAGIVKKVGCVFRKPEEAYLWEDANAFGCDPIPWSEWHEAGKWGYYLDRRQPFISRIEYPGSQGVFNLDSDILGKVLSEQLYYAPVRERRVNEARRGN